MCTTTILNFLCNKNYMGPETILLHLHIKLILILNRVREAPVSMVLIEMTQTN